MAVRRSKWDGTPRKWQFGIQGKTEVWDVDTTSFARAVKMFRVGCMFPHGCSVGRIQDEDERDGYTKYYLASKPGSKVSVSVLIVEDGTRRWSHITSIPVTDDAAEYDQKALPANIQALGETGEISKETGLICVNSEELRPCDVPRTNLAAAEVEIERRKAELKSMVHELNMQVVAMREELDRRMKQVWLIELFLGSKEEVLVLRQGAAAPVGTKVTAHQRVLCIDEELAVWHLLHAPKQVEEFCYENLEDFDEWLLRDPAHLDQILPQQKGIVALRIRRNPKKRIRYDTGLLSDMMAKWDEEECDRMTYLLIRNGENLYRLWVDVALWPRFFPRATEWDWMHAEGRTRWSSDETQVQEEQQRYVGGLLVLQGLVQRSTLFDPIDKKADVFAPDQDKHFDCLRNDELTAIGNGEVSWKEYRAWLEAQLQPGVRVSFRGRESYQDKLENRTGIRSIMDWPNTEDIYELEAGDPDRHSISTKFSFLYLPDEEVWGDRWTESSKRKKRVRFQCWLSELWPVDFIGWRVVESLIQNRGERHHYSESFPMIVRWYRLKRAEQEREQPFVNLVLSRAGCAEADRPRAERILGWWKRKTHAHRDLYVDEAKALRMCVLALKRGDDPKDSPVSPRAEKKKDSLKHRGENLR